MTSKHTQEKYPGAPAAAFTQRPCFRGVCPQPVMEYDGGTKSGPLLGDAGQGQLWPEDTRTAFANTSLGLGFFHAILFLSPSFGVRLAS